LGERCLGLAGHLIDILAVFGTALWLANFAVWVPRKAHAGPERAFGLPVRLDGSGSVDYRYHRDCDSILCCALLERRRKSCSEIKTWGWHSCLLGVRPSGGATWRSCRPWGQSGGIMPNTLPACQPVGREDVKL